MSKGVQDRIQLSRTVILAGYLYADVVAEAWNRLPTGQRQAAASWWQRVRRPSPGSI